ncbi:RagB/SusD family nutrient uptake outer membrane protein [Prevotella copri]|uniref:RagB/SusD family nutrient uptake outer membrane protein n=1 Tax=Segatella copri TaxID=165179 RepID=A0AA90UDN2_9BACT|nr:RagB/SusD family nutrient uptake outer membrane protein [Segatella copri]MQN11741.1 RagB/SusD family nutrient uptake outer membrane protein [Segatella copri]
MKLYIKYLTIGLMATTMLASCADILDKKPLTEISDNDLWSDPALLKAFVNSRYNQVGVNGAESMQSSIVDETELTWLRGCETHNFARLSPTDLGRMNGAWWGWDNRSWSTKWTNISNCNIFFERVDNVGFTDETEKTKLVGQVRFIRAFEYWDLIARWGAMPIITKSFSINDREEIVGQKRNTYKECIDFLVSELDQAAKELPANWSGDDYGRATSVAALALKSRILLYAASPLMNEDVKIPEVGYTTPEPDRWQKAAKAATEALDAAQTAGYELYNLNGDPSKNYQLIFMDNTAANKETLFARMGTSSADGESISSCDQYNNPNGYGGWGGNCPLQELVDAYEVVKDGVASKFDWNNPEEKANPYANRDPRFYATILYDGAKWMTRNVETYFDVDNNGTIIGGGKDTKFGNDSWNASPTGYNMKKFMDEGYALNSWNFCARNWIHLRMAELYLNKAEALYHIGDEDGAREALKPVRQRAGMPAVTATGADLLEAIKNERRIEFAFEEHRYFDVRRWKEAPKYFGSTVHAITIKKYPDGKKTYEVDKLRSDVGGDRKWDDKMYWLPIPKSEMDKNPNLVQNPGYNK